MPSNVAQYQTSQTLPSTTMQCQAMRSNATTCNATQSSSKLNQTVQFKSVSSNSTAPCLVEGGRRPRWGEAEQ
eukprot:5260440-Pyramimonas_sp.AAC.1